MNELSDSQLLRDYAEQHSEPAFAELVRRHVDLVYSAALRMVGEAHAAEDVAQAVFVALAQNASQLARHPVLSGWLHCTARNIAAKAVRSEVRRRAREQEAAAMNQLLLNEPEISWDRVAPHLDDALGELDEPERDALMLRYFEKKSAREMAHILGVSDDAAQKRVSRAVERLRASFARRGVSVGAGGLVLVVSAHAVQAAPAGLTAAISAATQAGTTLATTTTATVTKAIAMTTLQKTLVTAMAVLAGAGIYEARQAAQLRDQVERLQQQQAPLAGQIHQLYAELDKATNGLAELLAENSRLKTNPEHAELLKLRSEVTRLKLSSVQATNDTEETTVRDWTTRVKALKKFVQETPGCQIPEYQFLDENDWFMAIEVSANPWRTDVDIKRDMVPGLTERAKEHFAGMMINALRNYLEANSGHLPNQLTELKPYFPGSVPVGEDVLDRYELLHTGNVKDLSEHDRKFALVSEKKLAADSSTQIMMQMGDTSFANLASY